MSSQRGIAILAVLLLVSIGVNFFCAGGWLGWQLHHHPFGGTMGGPPEHGPFAGPGEGHPPPPGGPGDGGPREPGGGPTADIATRLDFMLRELPPDDQEIGRTVLHQHQDELVQRWTSLHNDIQAATALLRATPFDPDAVHAALAHTHQSSEEFRTALEATLIETAGKISPEGRTKLKLRVPP